MVLGLIFCDSLLSIICKTMVKTQNWKAKQTNKKANKIKIERYILPKHSSISVLQNRESSNIGKSKDIIYPFKIIIQDINIQSYRFKSGFRKWLGSHVFRLSTFATDHCPLLLQATCYLRQLLHVSCSFILQSLLIAVPHL